MTGPGFEEQSFPFVPGTDDVALMAGARNLLSGCAALQPGGRVVVLHEDPALGWYDLAAPVAVTSMAEAMGAAVSMQLVGGPDTPLPPEADSALQGADIEIWFARIGDQDRFAVQNTGRTKIVSYARTATALGSTYGTEPHGAMVALKQRLDTQLSMAAEIRLTCPLGTDLSGAPRAADAEDVSVQRFPMCVPRPVPAAGFSGRVALAGYLTPTGSRSYHPASVRLVGTVMAHLERGRITEFDGALTDVATIRAHYHRVATQFGIDPDVVHSFHAGLHTGCFHDKPVEHDPDLWSNTIFGSPEWLHFHTCGAYAPGEICWMVAKPTIAADGVALWRDGVLQPFGQG